MDKNKSPSINQKSLKKLKKKKSQAQGKKMTKNQNIKKQENEKDTTPSTSPSKAKNIQRPKEGREKELEDLNKNNERLFTEDVLKLKTEGMFPMKKTSSMLLDSKFYCDLCDCYCTNVDISKKHIKETEHLKAKELKLLEKSLSTLRMPSEDQCEAITSLLEDVIAKHTPTKGDISLRYEIKDDLERNLAKLVQGASLEVTGSFLSRFALKSSDLNLDVLVPETEKSSAGLLAIKKIFETPKHQFQDISSNFFSSHPFISAHLRKKGTGGRVVVGLSSLAARNTNRLLGHYNDLDARVQKLVVAFKYWAKLCQLSDQHIGALPSHCFPIMVVHFLQQVKPPVLPVLHNLVNDNNLQSYKTPDQLTPKWVSENTSSIGKLWVQLFRFYAVDFKMSVNVINVRFSQTYDRKETKWGKKMVIEDPFQIEKNMAMAVSSPLVYNYIYRCFKTTYRYFVTPQMKFGMLFKSLKLNNIDNILQGESNEVVEETYVDMNVDDMRESLPTVTPASANHLMKQVKKEMLHFTFKESNFTDGQKFPLFCTACQSSGHVNNDCCVYSLPPLVKLKPLGKKYIEILSELLYQLKDEYSLDPNEMKVRKSIVADLQAYIRKHIPGVVLTLFGSSANRFGFKNSDLDICLTFQQRRPALSSLDQIEMIEELAESLKNFGGCRYVSALTSAKVPIVKLGFRNRPLEADISLYNTLALRNTQLLSIYTYIDPRVQVLGYAMKYFVKLCDIGGASKGSLSSYAYILMVIHFLQQCKPPVVPVLQALYDRNKPTPELIIDGWNAWFYDDLNSLQNVWSSHLKNSQKVGELWVGLLRYYTEVFQWQDDVITIRQQEPLSKLEKFWPTRCIAIEDPFDLCRNLGGGLSRKMNAFILKSFIKARATFGTSLDKPPVGYQNLKALLFDKAVLTDGPPPNDRGCRWCGHIGHFVRNCPKKKRKEQQKEKAKSSKYEAKTENAAPAPPRKREVVKFHGKVKGEAQTKTTPQVNNFVRENGRARGEPTRFDEDKSSDEESEDDIILVPPPPSAVNRVGAR